MEKWALILAIAGGALNLAGALWLAMSSNPNNERYTNDGMLYPGMQPELAQISAQLVRDD